MSVDVFLEGDELVVRLGGWDAVVSFSTGVRTRLSDVVSVTVEPYSFARRESGIRLCGTWVPFLVRSGWYYRFESGWQLWCVYRARSVVVIQRRAKRLRRIVLEVPDPARCVASLRDDTGP
ncbi:MAG: hypothetical protein ABR520_08235 [Mycobacteriales bacterium]